MASESIVAKLLLQQTLRAHVAPEQGRLIKQLGMLEQLQRSSMWRN